MNTTIELIDYIRVIMYPLCALGFIISAIYEYQNGRSKLRLAIMLTTAITLLVFMLISISYIYYPTMLEPIREWGVTPIITLLTVLIWTYALMRVHKCRSKYNYKKGGCDNGYEVQ
jgi:hypothetical protein